MAKAASESPTLLVAVDFDDASRSAVALAVRYAQQLGGRIVLLHVVPPTSFPEGTRLLPTDGSDPVDLSEYVSARARRLLDEHFASLLTTGIEVRREARSGHVVDTILRAVEEAGATLVVVGTHGRTGATRAALGSVAENVIRRSPVPVLVARAEGAGRAHGTAFAGAATLTAAVAGAAAGALGGPAGALAGGAIGGVVGAVVGATMVKEEIRTDAHDRDLDDDIGVTRGTVGTRAENKRPSRDVIREADEGARNRS